MSNSDNGDDSEAELGGLEDMLWPLEMLLQARSYDTRKGRGRIADHERSVEAARAVERRGGAGSSRDGPRLHTPDEMCIVDLPVPDPLAACDENDEASTSACDENNTATNCEAPASVIRREYVASSRARRCRPVAVGPRRKPDRHLRGAAYQRQWPNRSDWDHWDVQGGWDRHLP